MAPITDFVGGRLVSSQQDSFQESPQLGVLTIATLLQGNSYQVDVVDWVADNENNFKDIVQKLLHYDLILFSSNSMNWATNRLVARHVKKQKDIFCLFGGPHPTLYPNETLAESSIDAIYVGEVDISISLIVSKILNNSINEISDSSFCSKNHIHTTSEQSQLELEHTDFDYFLPNYSLIDISKYRTVPVETSRGCKFRCTFCSIPSKSKWRGYSISGAINRIHHGAQFSKLSREGVVSIIDDTFTTDHDRAIEIANRLDISLTKERITFDATVVDLRNDTLVKSLAPHCSALLVGVEAPNKSQTKIIKKASAPILVEQALANLKASSLTEKCVLSMIIGFPWQKMEDCLETIKYSVNLISDYGVTIYLQWYWPFPGSNIWRDLELEGKVNLSFINYPGYFRDINLFRSIKNLSNDEIDKIDNMILKAKVILESTGNGGLVYTSIRDIIRVNLPMRNPLIHKEII